MTSSQNIKTLNVNVEQQNIMEKENADVVMTRNGELKTEKNTIKHTMQKIEKNSGLTHGNTIVSTTRNLYRAINTSSPDRSLEHALKMWPEIKKAVPEAEFHIAYGFQIFDVMHKDNPGAQMWKENLLKMMQHEGIVDHGRLPQPELAELLKTCGVWVYPTHFGEINCISALKAQYYGAEPVVVNYAALKETVQFGRRIEGDIYDELTQEKFKNEWIDALKNPMSETQRSEMMTWGKQWEWSNIAKSWTKEFGGVK